MKCICEKGGADGYEIFLVFPSLLFFLSTSFPLESTLLEPGRTMDGEMGRGRKRKGGDSFCGRMLLDQLLKSFCVRCCSRLL